MGNSINNPLVTVQIPAYNHEKYVGESIQSVIDQTYENIELIIINDGSRDKTHDVILTYIEMCKKRFVRFEYRNRENKGLSATKMEFLSWAKGKYFTGIASDDIILPDKVSLLVSKLENLDNSYAVAFGDAIFIDEHSKRIYLDVKTGKQTLSDKGFYSFLDYYTNGRNFDYKDEKVFGSYETLLVGNYLPAMSAIMKTKIIREVGGWTSGNSIEDWEMWLKLAQNYKFSYVNEPIALYRWHDSNSMKTNTKQLEIDTMNLLLDNKEYALQHNLKAIWELSYYYKLIAFLMKYEYKLFIDYFNPVYSYSFTIFTVKKIIKKINFFISKFIDVQ